MTSKRLYLIMLGAVALMIMLLLGGAYGLSQLLQRESKQLVSNRLQVQTLSDEQIALAKAQAEIKTYQDLATIAKSVVPQDKDQAQTISQIVSLASSNHISLSSITFPSSTLGGGAGKTDLSQLAPVPGLTGVYALQLNVVSDSGKPVPFTSLISFLHALEHNRRTALVQSIAISPNANDRSKLSFTLTLNEYIKP